MRLRDAATASGVSAKQIRRYIAAGKVTPAVIKTRYGVEYDLSEADIAAVKAAHAAAQDEKRGKNRDHRSEVIATERDLERLYGGKRAKTAVRALSRGESVSRVLETMARSGRSIQRLDWSLLVDVYQTAFGTCNPVELKAMGAPLPQTVARTRLKVLQRLSGASKERVRVGR